MAPEVHVFSLEYMYQYVYLQTSGGECMMQITIMMLLVSNRGEKSNDNYVVIVSFSCKLMKLLSRLKKNI